MDEHEAWQRRVAEAGGRPTPVIDRFWFRSIYFREPSGVLFEIATLGPGFATDEDPAHLGETLILPPAFEHLRAQVEPILTPLPEPARTGWARREPAGARASGGRRARGRARPLPRPRRRRARPLPAARRARPGAAPPRLHAARAARTAAGRRALVRRRACRLSAQGDVRYRSRARRGMARDIAVRARSGSCSAASRRAR